MVLSRLTKITGPGIRTDTNWVGNNANYTGILTASSLGGIGNLNSTGIITATKFVGPVEGNVTAVDGTFSGNVSIAGTLTYEDVINVDSVGVITARSGLVSPNADIDDFVSVGSNIHLGNAGVVTATSFVGSGAALTGIDATSIKDSSGNVKIQAQASGAIHTGISTFDTIKVGSGVTIESNGQATFTGIVTFGSGSTTIDNNVVNVGTALTLGHTQGLQFHTQNLHSQGFEVNQINASGIVTASTFSGSGANLTNLPAQATIANNADNRVITGGSGVNLNGEANLTFDGSTLGLTGNQIVSGNLTLNDNANLYFGTSGAELKVRSDGSDVYVEGQGSGNIFMKAAGGENVAGFFVGASKFVRLYHNSNTKLETTSSGISVTGTVAATAFTGDGSNLTGLASREFYGFVGVGNSLSLTTTNSGADNIDGATYAAFEESFIGPSGISFSINTSGNLIMTV